MEKHFKPIYRNIQYKPKIWGISYINLFIVLLIMLFSMLFLKGFGLVVGIVGGAICTVIAYTYFFYKDNRDAVEAAAKEENFLKDSLTSYTISNQTINFEE
jgi:O-antigen/teichoic acid export membrane protein